MSAVSASPATPVDHDGLVSPVARFWTFSQNNSGGSFDYQPNDGITHYVIVEASNSTHALQRAMDIGLYFNGCASGVDCSCCGDRWSQPWSDDGDPVPFIYGEPVPEIATDRYGMSGMYSLFEKGQACVHYLDGRKEWRMKVSA